MGEGPKEEDNKKPMICRYIDEGVVGSSMGLFLIGGAAGRRFCHKTQKGPVKCVYCVCVLCMVYSFPPCG